VPRLHAARLADAAARRARARPGPRRRWHWPTRRRPAASPTRAT
jgi:hypothetical protein